MKKCTHGFNLDENNKHIHIDYNAELDRLYKKAFPNECQKNKELELRKKELEQYFKEHPSKIANIDKYIQELR